MSKSNFQDMKVWQRARVLAREVYLEKQRYPRVEMFGLSQQMRRAAVSVLCNIAEGQGRWSRADARNFAVMARGSVLEIEAQLVVWQISNTSAQNERKNWSPWQRKLQKCSTASFDTTSSQAW